MSEVHIRGGIPLGGTVVAHGAKNAILPILAATLLFDKTTIVLHDVPQIQDVRWFVRILQELGVDVERHHQELTLKVPSKELLLMSASDESVTKIRASLLLLGPLLSVKQAAKIAWPGGCSIGYRPIDFHIMALQQMGVEITLEHGMLLAQAPNGLQAAHIYLDSPSIGATESIIMAAVLTEGTTTIDNAAKDPEVLDLIRFLNAAGAKIKGAGTSEIQIEGVHALQGIAYEVIPDRVEIATYMVAAAITRGKLTIQNTIPTHLEALIAKLREIGVTIMIEQDTIIVDATNLAATPDVIDVRTGPYPKFHTDIQVLLLPFLMTLQTNSIIIDTVFGLRYQHVAEFLKVGADIVQFDNMLVVGKNHHFVAGKMESSDLRAAASMVLFGLAYPIDICITKAEHLDRGYEAFISTLTALGAQINQKRIKTEENHNE